MKISFLSVASIIVTVIFVSIACFHVLLSFGCPFGEFAMGGSYKILPKNRRVLSVGNALILLFMSVVFLQHAYVIKGLSFLPTNPLVWVITIFLGLNTIANLLSRSKKERYTMTPISGIAFILCLFIALS